MPHLIKAMVKEERGKVLDNVKGETPIHSNRQVMQRQTCTR